MTFFNSLFLKPAKLYYLSFYQWMCKLWNILLDIYLHICTFYILHVKWTATDNNNNNNNVEHATKAEADDEWLDHEYYVFIASFE